MTVFYNLPVYAFDNCCSSFFIIWRVSKSNSTKIE